MRFRTMLLTVPIAAVLMLTMAHTSAKADTTRHFHWIGAWPWPDCVYECDPDLAGCATNPDCHCDCFR